MLGDLHGVQMLGDDRDSTKPKRSADRERCARDARLVERTKPGPFQRPHHRIGTPGIEENGQLIAIAGER